MKYIKGCTSQRKALTSLNSHRLIELVINKVSLFVHGRLLSETIVEVINQIFNPLSETTTKLIHISWLWRLGCAGNGFLFSKRIKWFTITERMMISPCRKKFVSNLILEILYYMSTNRPNLNFNENRRPFGVQFVTQCRNLPLKCWQFPYPPTITDQNMLGV